MNGLLFVICIIGIGVVLWWCRDNDRVAPDEPTGGLLAMPDESPPPAPPSDRGRPFLRRP